METNEILIKLKEATRVALQKKEEERNLLRLNEQEERVQKTKDRAKEIFNTFFSEEKIMAVAMKGMCSYPVLYMKNGQTPKKNSKGWIKFHEDIKIGRNGELVKFLYFEILNHGFVPEVMRFYFRDKNSPNIDEMKSDTEILYEHEDEYEDDDINVNYNGHYLGIEW